MESLLQELLANYPDLLVGNQVDPQSPRRWLHVSREAGIPGEEGGSGRWSLDHLFLDQDGIPTLVEVKRSTDTRIRREVVGQMLDYAANSIVYWPADSIRAQFERTCELKQTDPEQELVDFLGDGFDPEEFWQSTKLNLQAGRIRMIFVADIIPLELQRIVEFLNGQMNPAQVLAIEVPQYRGAVGLAAFAPRVVGQTAAAHQSKNAVRSSQSGSWDRNSFLADVDQRLTSKGAEAMGAVLNWGGAQGLQTQFGKGPKYGSVRLKATLGRSVVPIAWLYSGGTITIELSSMDEFAPWVGEAQKELLTTNASRLPNARGTAAGFNQNVTCDHIASANATSQLIDVLQSLLDAVTKDQNLESMPPR